MIFTDDITGTASTLPRTHPGGTEYQARMIIAGWMRTVARDGRADEMVVDLLHDQRYNRLHALRSGIRWRRDHHARCPDQGPTRG
jgi:hypothetical protein